MDLLPVESVFVDLLAVVDVVLAGGAVRRMILQAVNALRCAFLVLGFALALLRVVVLETFHASTGMTAHRGSVTESLTIVALRDAFVRAVESLPAYAEVAE